MQAVETFGSSCQRERCRGVCRLFLIMVVECSIVQINIHINSKLLATGSRNEISGMLLVTAFRMPP